MQGLENGNCCGKVMNKSSNRKKRQKTEFSD